VFESLYFSFLNLKQPFLFPPAFEVIFQENPWSALVFNPS
jgi:hypothetical protein